MTRTPHGEGGDLLFTAVRNSHIVLADARELVVIPRGRREPRWIAHNLSLCRALPALGTLSGISAFQITVIHYGAAGGDASLLTNRGIVDSPLTRRSWTTASDAPMIAPFLTRLRRRFDTLEVQGAIMIITSLTACVNSTSSS